MPDSSHSFQNADCRPANASAEWHDAGISLREIAAKAGRQREGHPHKLLCVCNHDRASASEIRNGNREPALRMREDFSDLGRHRLEVFRRQLAMHTSIHNLAVDTVFEDIFHGSAYHLPPFFVGTLSKFKSSAIIPRLQLSSRRARINRRTPLPNPPACGPILCRG